MNDPMNTINLPLQVRRRSSQKAFSRTSSKRPLSTSSRSKSLPRARSQRQPKMEQFTPPLTPSSSSESLTPSGTPTALQFHDYVRALYAYHPPYDRNSDTVTLPLNRGDIFLVHSIHPSGWADATLLDSGIRGWLPTNYCEAYSPDHIRNLLNALTQLYEIVPNCARGDISALCNLEYTRPMVAGVRYLLDSTKCLGRDAHLVAAQTGINGLRRYRKGMLGELSTFLRYAEDVACALKGTYSQADLDSHCNQLMLDACRTVLRAAKFLDIWTEETGRGSALTISVSASENLTPKPSSHIVPPTPPADVSDFESTTNGVESPVPGSTESTKTPTQATITLAPAIVTSRDVRSPEPTESFQQFPPRGISLPQRGRPLSMQNVRRASYRISMITRGNDANLANSAFSKLTHTYDRLNENLLSFGAISPGVSTPNDVLLATGETLQSGRQMLKVVDAVCDRSPQNFALAHTREQMYRQLHDLVLVAKQVFDENSPIPMDMRMSPASLQTVSDCATQCIQIARDCSSASQRIMERIGDFELEEPTSVTKSGPPSEAPTEVPTEVPMEVPTEVPQSAITEDEPQTEAEEAGLDLSDTQEPLDVSNFPMPVTGSLTLPLLDTGVTSLEDITSPPSASTVATPDSQQSSTASATEVLTPCTPFSTQGEGFENCTLENEDPLVMVASEYTSTPTSRNTSARNSAQSVTTIESYTNTSPQSSFDCALTPCESVEEIEKTLQAQTYAHELFFGKDGQVCGGSLPALVERLTSGDSMPEVLFVTTFFLTFRIFTTPEELARTLIDRFEYLQGDDQSALPVRLRVYNVLKQWLESYWRNDTDQAALDLITPFAETRLLSVLPSVGQRVVDLTKLVMASDAPLVPRQNSVVGRTQTSNVPTLRHISPIAQVPAPTMSKQDTALLNAWKTQGVQPKITDFKSLEVARQLTVKVSKLFCSIKPEELLQREWMKPVDSRAVNVKAMSQMSNDLVSFITESILAPQEPKKRAKCIKHWIKIGSHCVELNNLFVAVQVSAALTMSTINRLHKSWEHVPVKHKASLANIISIFEPHHNRRAYRGRLATSVGPCIPFLGTHQTDLYHIDEHDRDFRPAMADFFTTPIINFEKHTKTARVIVDLQRFQVAYRLEEVLDLQSWLQDQLIKVRAPDSVSFMMKQQDHYFRSCTLEPGSSK